MMLREPSPTCSCTLVFELSAGQPNERDGPARLHPLVSEDNGILTNRAEIRRQPITDIYELLGQSFGKA